MRCGWILVGLWMLGCSAGAGGRPELRHASLVRATVLRGFTVEDELNEERRRLARSRAVERIAEALDDVSDERASALRLDVQIAEIDEQQAHVRARCLITVSTVGPPERTRSILQGAATATRGSGDDTLQAVDGAVRSALRRLPQAAAAID